MHRIVRAAPLVLALAALRPALAQVPAGFEAYRLDNGLTVLLWPDPRSPVVTVDVWYDVGSRNERPGRSGFAHLFEHMMFQGSENVGKTEHLTLIERAGGSVNGSTTEDRTNYFETLPPHRLNLGLWLEADRMRSLAITQENFENQRQVVKEERRLRIDNSPYGPSYLAALYELPYNPQTCYAYAHSVIGSMADLDAAKLEDVRAFFDAYYAPNNATVTVVGNFDPEVAKRLVQEYFGGIPRRDPPPQVECRDPFRLPRRDTIVDRIAPAPAVFLSHGMPAVDHQDIPALELLASILAEGESSRLYQRLVRQEKAAVNVTANADVRRGPGIFIVFAIATPGTAPDRLERLLLEEIDRVARDGVRPEELEKARNQVRANRAFAAQTALGKAEMLQWAKHFLGDPRAAFTLLDRYRAVTAADIQRVARTYLTAQNRGTLITMPASANRGGTR